jgi:hypothetical protein
MFIDIGEYLYHVKGDFFYIQIRWFTALYKNKVELGTEIETVLNWNIILYRKTFVHTFVMFIDPIGHVQLFIWGPSGWGGVRVSRATTIQLKVFHFC